MKLRPAFVVALASLPGCAPSQPPQPPPEPASRAAASSAAPAPSVAPTAVVTNPPPPAESPTPDTSARPKARGPFTKGKNARDPSRGWIYRSAKGCFVRVPDGRPRQPGELPPAVDVPCPASMTGEAWRECLGDVVMSNDAGDACECFIGGNPPPPPAPMTRCP